MSRAEFLVDAARDAGMTVTTAESCTGGMVAAAILAHVPEGPRIVVPAALPGTPPALPNLAWAERRPTGQVLAPDLFQPTRGETAPEPVRKVPELAANEPGLKLLGVFRAGAVESALLAIGAAGDPKWVSPGEKFAGRKLVSISRSSATLTWNGTPLTIYLDRPNNMTESSR